MGCLLRMAEQSQGITQEIRGNENRYPSSKSRRPTECHL